MESRTFGTQGCAAASRHANAPDDVPASSTRRERERERLRKVWACRQQERRENPSPAAAQRYREYLLWTETRPVQFGDEPPNDTYEIFMKERRRAKEKARLQGVARKRQAERQLQRQTVVSDAALASPAAQPAAKRPRGRPADPNTEQRRRDRRELQREKSLAQQHRRDARDAARAGQQVRSTLQFMELNLTRAKAAGFNPWGALPDDSTHVQAYAFWRSKALGAQVDANRMRRMPEADALAATAFARTLTARAAKAGWAAAAERATTADAIGEARAASAAAAAHARYAEAVAVAAAGAQSVASKQRRRRESGSLSALLQPSQPWVSAAFAAVSAPLPECGLDADGAAPPALLPPPPPPGQPALTDAVVPRVWSTEGQCEGMTRQSGGTERCRVHRNSPYAVAAPLRRGERYCGHHHPDKFTGVQCAGQRKHGKGRCRVWSGCCYADAAPLRRGSPYCHHHRVRCVGLTQSGARCTVTSSSENVHAQPLRDGELHCAHHQPAAPSSLAPSAPCPRAAVSDRAIVLGSSEDFEGPDGPLPPSIAIVESEARLEQGNCLTQLLRRFPALHYTSIKYSDPTLPHLWVLPLEGQTAQTGRLADFMVSLGLTVREQDLDYESSDDDAASDVDSARCDEPLDPDVEAELPDYF